MRLLLQSLRCQLLLFVALTLAMPVTLKAQTVHHIKTVFLIVMENHNWTGDGSLEIYKNPAAPYINYTLLPEASYARNYNNPPGIHPSLPNYIYLEAGSSLGIRADGNPSQFHQSTTDHLTTLLEGSGNGAFRGTGVSEVLRWPVTQKGREQGLAFLSAVTWCDPSTIAVVLTGPTRGLIRRRS